LCLVCNLAGKAVVQVNNLSTQTDYHSEMNDNTNIVLTAPFRRANNIHSGTLELSLFAV